MKTNASVAVILGAILALFSYFRYSSVEAYFLGRMSRDISLIMMIAGIVILVFGLLMAAIGNKMADEPEAVCSGCKARNSIDNQACWRCGRDLATSRDLPTQVQPAASHDLITQIERLNSLKERGMLSEDEYKAAKARLLA